MNAKYIFLVLIFSLTIAGCGDDPGLVSQKSPAQVVTPSVKTVVAVNTPVVKKSLVTGWVFDDATGEINWYQEPSKLPKGALLITPKVMPKGGPTISPAQVVAVIGAYAIVQYSPTIAKWLTDHEVKNSGTWEFDPNAPGLLNIQRLTTVQSALTMIASQNMRMYIDGTPLNVQTNWAGQLNAWFETANAIELTQWVEAYNNTYAVNLAAGYDLEWTQDLDRVPAFARDHAKKHALDVNCFKEIVMARRLGPNILESWMTDIRAAKQPRIAVLVGLHNLQDAASCLRLRDSWNGQKGQTPVLIVIFNLDLVTGRLSLEPGRSGPIPVTVYTNTIQNWRTMPGVRCGMYNQFPVTIKLWPGFETAPCP